HRRARRRAGRRPHASRGAGDRRHRAGADLARHGHVRLAHRHGRRRSRRGSRVTDRDTSSSFGPNALLTPANAITLARLAATPILLASIVETGDSWSTLAFWILLA